jgi:hypothetical protein
MGAALVTDVGVATIGAGPVITAATAGTGSTFTVRNFPFTAKANLIDMWFQAPHAGMIRVRSPKFADNVQGIRVNGAGTLQGGLITPSSPQFLVPQDTLTVELNGTAADVNFAAIQSYYTDLSGAAPVMKMPGDISSQMQWLDTWVVAITTSGTAGAINSTAITTTYDVSQANRWYAVLGYVVDTAVGAVGITGADLSNLNVMGPGTLLTHFTRNYFADLSMKIGAPCIPVFNTANKGNTNIVAANEAASLAVNVTLNVAIMPQGWNP